MFRARVALIGPVPEDLGGAPGGVATHQVYVARGLAAAGIDVSLLATVARAAGVADGRLTSDPLPIVRMWAPRTLADWVDPRYLRAVGVRRLLRYATFAARQTPGPLAASRRVLLGDLLWYARYLADARPDVVHVQHPLERHLYVRIVTRLEGWRPPVVVTLHSLFGEHSEQVIHDLMAPNLAHADRLIAVSPHVAEQAIQLGADPDKVRVIRSGVDVEHFRPRERASARAELLLAPDQRIVLFVGTLEPRKQVDRLLLALPAVRAEVPSTMCVLIGTGDVAGPDDQTPLLRRIVQEHGLGEAIRFVGRVSDAELVRWYAAADVFALPSSSEGQGIVALEAMASGLPVVASAVGGLVDAVDDGQTGALVQQGDVPTLARRLIELLRDACLRERMGVAAREKVKSHFTWAATIRQTIDVYREVLADATHGRTLY